MKVISFRINGKAVSYGKGMNAPLLWVIRDELGLKGTKFGCGIGMCGACTVHVDGKPVRSCSTPVGLIDGKSITTIEGLSGPIQNALNEAWVMNQVPQCGYCQSGQIMQAADLLRTNPSPSDDEINEAMNGNLCRCMSYIRIRKAIKSAAEKLQGESV